MKKFFALLITLCLAFSLFACDGCNPEKDPTTPGGDDSGISFPMLPLK